MLHYITRTALNQLIEAGKVHDCAEGYGCYVVALTAAKFGKGLGTILLVKWHEIEYWAKRMAGHLEMENLEPGWSGAYQVEVWYVMEDEWYDVDDVWDPNRPTGRTCMLTFLDDHDEEVKTPELYVNCHWKGWGWYSIVGSDRYPYSLNWYEDKQDLIDDYKSALEHETDTRLYAISYCGDGDVAFADEIDEISAAANAAWCAAASAVI